MRKRTAVLMVALVAALAFGVAATDTAATRFDGDWKWVGGMDGRLEAEFRPVGGADAKKWEVDFHLNFEGRDLVYSGTAKGSIEDGNLNGKVRNYGGTGGRTWTFRGRFRDGKFHGTHYELDGVKPRKTGTLNLR